MIVMIEELDWRGGEYQFAEKVCTPDGDHVVVRRAWVQHASEFVRLGNGRPRDKKATFMGLPLRIADAKKWNELLLLEGSGRVTALDWPPPTISGDHFVRPPLPRVLTKYVA